jgi:Tol biopolymer transport system component
MVLLVSQGGEPAREAPPLRDGRLLFHRYTNYDAWDGKLYLYDFATRSLTCLSASWPIDHAMNAHFAPDGKRIVFMGVPRGQHDGRRWDIYLWELESARDPINLTAENGLRDEDPKFAPDGRTVVFKQDGRIAFLDPGSQRVLALTSLKPGTEWSMPIFTTGGQTIVAMAGARETGDLYAIDRESTKLTPIATTTRVQEYYPVPWDENRLLYVRWRSAEDRNDQVYAYLWKEKTAKPLRFCQPDANNSDPWPIDERQVVFSSTRSGGKGGYDLYLGDAVSGRAVPLSASGINTPAEELGSCYYVRRR